MATRHRVAFYALFLLALAVLAGYVATVVMVVVELTHPALAATSGACFICMSPWVQTEFLIGLIDALLILVVGLACLGTSLARRDTAWPLAFLGPLALIFGFAVLAFSGAADAMIITRVGPGGRNVMLLGAAACALLIPLLALFYSQHLRRAWKPKRATSASSAATPLPPPGP